MADPYPLHWPEGWPRTRGRTSSAFTAKGFGMIRDGLLRELRLLGTRHVVLSTNLRLRGDGLPLSKQAQHIPDPGAAVFFHWRGKPFQIACDTYNTVWENVHAMTKTIEAMRSISRHGATQLLERAVSGFSALPPGEDAEPEKVPDPWWDVLGLPTFDGVTFVELASDDTHPMRLPMLKMAETVYRAKLVDAHPDHGGSHELMSELNRAIEDAREALGI